MTVTSTCIHIGDHFRMKAPPRIETLDVLKDKMTLLEVRLYLCLF